MDRHLITGFHRLNEDSFAARVGCIVEGMTNNRFFPEPWWKSIGSGPTVASLTEDLQAYSLAKSEASCGSNAARALRKSLRAKLTADLRRLAQYIELKAGGNEEMLKSSGYALTKVPSPPRSTPLPAPQNLRLKKGDLSGTLVATCSAVRGAGSYEAHICEGAPGVASNWKQIGVFATCRRMVIKNLTPGVLYHVRVRAINFNGMGAWSDVASLRAD